MPITSAQRQAKFRAEQKARGLVPVTMYWPEREVPELNALRELLQQRPGCTFLAAYRDERGRIKTMKENRG